jgi:preprotein translocase subunit SecD
VSHGPRLAQSLVTLITVPSIDFKQYPDGINGDLGADIGGDLTSRSAKDLAILLRFGPLPADFRAAG